MKRLLLALTLSASSATGQTLTDRQDADADAAQAFVMYVIATDARRSVMSTVEFGDHPTGPENELACQRQINALTIAFGRKGWGIEGDCLPKSRGDN